MGGPARLLNMIVAVLVLVATGAYLGVTRTYALEHAGDLTGSGDSR